MKHHRLVDITAVYCLTENVNVAVTSNQDKLFSCQTRGPCTAGLVCDKEVSRAGEREHNLPFQRQKISKVRIVFRAENAANDQCIAHYLKRI